MELNAIVAQAEKSMANVVCSFEKGLTSINSANCDHLDDKCQVYSDSNQDSGVTLDENLELIDELAWRTSMSLHNIRSVWEMALEELLPVDDERNSPEEVKLNQAQEALQAICKSYHKRLAALWITNRKRPIDLRELTGTEEVSGTNN